MILQASSLSKKSSRKTDSALVYDQLHLGHGWLSWQSVDLVQLVVEFRITPAFPRFEFWLLLVQFSILDLRRKGDGGGDGQGGGEFPSRNLKMMASYTNFFTRAFGACCKYT